MGFIREELILGSTGHLNEEDEFRDGDVAFGFDWCRYGNEANRDGELEVAFTITDTAILFSFQGRCDAFQHLTVRGFLLVQGYKILERVGFDCGEHRL